MNIYEALKDKTKDLRLTHDAEHKWLIWDDDINSWAVFSKKPYQRMTGCLYHGDSCDTAVEILCRED